MNFSITAIHAALWLFVVFQGLLIVALLHRLEEVRHLLSTVDVPGAGTLAPGASAPPFETVGVRSGRTIDVETFSSRGGVLLFLSTQCKACARLAADIRSQQVLPDNLVVLWRGDADELAVHVGPDVDAAVANVPSIAALFQIRAFPTAVIIDERHVIAGYAHPSGYAELARIMASFDITSRSEQPRYEQLLGEPSWNRS